MYGVYEVQRFVLIGKMVCFIGFPYVPICKRRESEWD